MADDQSQTAVGPSAVGTWNTPPMNLDAWRTLYPIMQGTNDRNQYMNTMGGPQMAQMKMQDQMQKAQAADQLSNFLKLKQVYPGMQMPPSVQQSAGQLFASPLQSMLGGQQKMDFGSQDSTQYETQQKIKSADTLMKYITGLPPDQQHLAAAALGMKTTGLTPGQDMKKNTITKSTAEAIKSGAIWDPMNQAYIKPKRSLTRDDMISNIMSVSKQTGIDLLSDPSVVSALDQKFPAPVKTAKGDQGPGLLEKIGKGVQTVATDALTNMAQGLMSNQFQKLVTAPQKGMDERIQKAVARGVDQALAARYFGQQGDLDQEPQDTDSQEK